MDTGVYMIENVANGKRYIGSAVRMSWRKTKHWLHLSRGTHHSRHLQQSWNKHGPDSFRFVPLLFCNRGQILFYEQRLLDGLAPEYNVCKIANSCAGVKRTDEFKRKLSAARKGLTVSDETKRKISASLSGRVNGPMSDEARQRLSAASLVRANGKGHGHMRSLAEAKRGVPRTEEVRLKLSISGSKLSEGQVREIRSKALKGLLHREIAKEYGVTTSCIGALVRGKTYRWVD